MVTAQCEVYAHGIIEGGGEEESEEWKNWGNPMDGVLMEGRGGVLRNSRGNGVADLANMRKGRDHDLQGRRDNKTDEVTK